MTWVMACLTDKQKHNGWTNGQKIIEVYNFQAFIANRSKTIKDNNCTRNEGQRPIKRHKEPEQSLYII